MFFDFEGTHNRRANRELRARAARLRQDLVAFVFTDPSLINWSLKKKQAEVERLLEAAPEDAATAALFADWSRALAKELPLVGTVSAGTIMAEAKAARIIRQWERGLPKLKLRVLLDRI